MSKKKITIVISEYLDDLVENCSKQKFMTKSGFIEWAISELLKSLNNEESRK